MRRSAAMLVGGLLFLCMAIGVLGALSPSPMWQNDNDSVRHEPPLKGKDKVEPHDATALRHKDIMDRATNIIHEAAGHKMISTDAGMELQYDMQPVNVQLEPEHFTNVEHIELQKQLKGAANKLRELLPSLQSMHDEVQSHIETLHGPQNMKAQMKAMDMQDTLKRFETLSTNHGEDAPGTVKDGKKKSKYGLPDQEPTQDLIVDLNLAKKEVLRALERFPKAKTPAQSLQGHAKETMTSPSRAGSSRPHH